MALCCLIVFLLMRSPWGRVLKGIREDEDAVRSLGKNVYAYKMQSLIIGGVFGALAGFMSRCSSAAINPSFFATDITFFAYTVLLIGGAARVLRPGRRRGHLLVPDQLPRRVLRPGDRGHQPADPGLDHDRTAGQPDAVHLHGPGTDAADDLPTTRNLRRPKGAGARCPLTTTTTHRADHGRSTVDTSAARAALRDVAHEPGAPKPDPIVVADGVRRTFGGLTAVDVEHVEIQRGVITALIGPNGAGKTTFFNLLTGFDTPDEGEWSFNGRSLKGVPAYRVARRGMVRTFQLTKVLSRLTVIENMRIGATGQSGESLLERDVRAAVARPGGRATPSGPTACSRASCSMPSARTSPARCPAVSASCSRWRGR